LRISEVNNYIKRKKKKLTKRQEGFWGHISDFFSIRLTQRHQHFNAFCSLWVENSLNSVLTFIPGVLWQLAFHHW
jgi:hypothetical protein